MAKTLDQGLAGIFQTDGQETEAIVRPVDTEELAPPAS